MADKRLILIKLATPANNRVISRLLEQQAFPFQVCRDLDSMLAKAADDCGVLLLDEEKLSVADVEKIIAMLANQPAWSDLPVVLLIRRQRFKKVLVDTKLKFISNLTMVEHPVSSAALISVLQTALESRHRQYYVRDLLTDLQSSNEDLAKRVRQAEIVENTDVMLAYLDRDFAFTWVNSAYAERGKLKPDEIVGRNHFDLYPDEENEIIFRQVRDTGEPVFFKDKPYIFPNQPERGVTYWDWSLVPVKGDDGRIEGLVLSLRETTVFKQIEMNLAESEERFRTMAETSMDIIFQVDRRGGITYLSPAVLDLGYSPKEIRGKHFSELVAAEDLPKAEIAFQQVLGGKKIELFSIRLVSADGSPVDCEINATPVTCEDLVVGIQGIARDITERREAEEKISRHNEILQGINSIFVAGLHCETDEELAMECLRIAINLTGSRFGFIDEIGPDGLLYDIAISDPGWQQCAMADKNGHGKVGRGFRITGLHGKVLKENKPLIANDPSAHPASSGIPEGHPPLSAFLGVPLVYGDRLIGLIALANRQGGYGLENIDAVDTLAKAFVETLFKCRTERALAESEARERSNAMLFKQFLDFTPIPVFVAHDAECRNITANIAGARMLGVKSDSNISQTPRPGEKIPLIRFLRDGRELAPEELPLQHVVRHGVSLDSVDVQIVNTEGKSRDMLGAAAPLFDDGGEVMGGISAYMDITERKLMETQLHEAKQKWEMANFRLQRSNEDLQNFASIVSHDLKAPLRTISSFVQLLARKYRDRLDDKAQTFMNHIVEGTGHMQQLLDDLLQYSSVGGGELELENIHLAEVMDDIVTRLVRDIKRHSAEITYTGLPVVEGDRLQLFTLLQNLVSNSLKYRAKEKPRIEITTERQDGHWQICVKDYGIGIDPKHNEQIFLIFKRLHLQDEYEGTGVGLAICKRIVERHGGRIWVESAPGEGAAFYFTLPVRRGTDHG